MEIRAPTWASLNSALPQAETYTVPGGSSTATYAATTALAGDPGWINYDECSVPVYVGGASDPMTTIHSPARTITLPVPAGAAPTVCDDHNFTDLLDLPCTKGFARVEGGAPSPDVPDVNDAYDFAGVVSTFSVPSGPS